MSEHPRCIECGKPIRVRNGMWWGLECDHAGLWVEGVLPRLNVPEGDDPRSYMPEVKWESE